MAETMIERAAFAVWKARELQFPERVRRMSPDDIDKATGAWLSCVELARAAIGALREPTDHIRDVMNDVCIEGPDYVWFYPSLNDCGELFTAGIDAALSEGGE